MPPEISEQKLESLKSRKEEKETNELGVDEFVRDINHLLDASGDRLKDLPPTFQDAFHDNVVQYLLTSAQQYDTNTEQGLSKDEFEKYKDDMLRKVDEIIARYTLSEEMLDACEQQGGGGRLRQWRQEKKPVRRK